MTSLFDVGKSALNSYRQSLAVTGQNIANINTEGYKRREASLEEVTGSQGSVTSLANQTGLGVRVTDIKRSFDQYLLDRARTAISSFEKLDTYVDQVRQLENMLLPEKGGLGELIGSFFDSLREVAADPSQLAARTVAIEQGKAMASGFNNYSLRLAELKNGISAVMGDSIASVNMLANQLAEINGRILSAGQSGQSPNSIYDLRDRVISDLSKLTDLTVDYEDRGIANIKLGPTGVGPTIVSRTDSFQIDFDETFSGLQPVVVANGERRTTNQITTGIIAGLADAFTTANEALKEIDQLAILMSREMNIQHRAGVTLDGMAGDNMFSNNGLSLFTGRANRTDVSGEIFVTDPEKLPMGELVATYSSENDIWTLEGDGLNEPLRGSRQISGPGFSLTINGQAATGDTLILSPENGASANFKFILEKPQQLAASADVLISASSKNQSDAGIDIESVQPQSDVSLANLEQVFTNSSSPIEASQFFRDGFIAEIPAGTKSASLSSLNKQAQVKFQLTTLELAQLKNFNFRITDVPEFDAQNYITSFEGPILTAVADGTYRITDNEIQSYTGSGTGAVFDVIVTAGSANISVIDGGEGFYADDRLSIPGTVFGGVTPADDMVITVSEIANPVTGPFSIDVSYLRAFPQSPVNSVWSNTADLADMLNRGILKTGDNQTIQSLGLYASGGNGTLTLTSSKGNFDSSEDYSPRLLVGGGLLAGTVSNRIEASNIQIFTKEGRHILGNSLSEEEIANIMTAENGFREESIYKADYLNQSDPAYRGMDLSIKRAGGNQVLLTGSNGTSASAVAAFGRMPQSAAIDQTISITTNIGKQFNIDLVGGASAADASELINESLKNTDILASAIMKVELSDFSNPGTVTFGLESENLEAINISATIIPDDLSNLASSINGQSNRTGVIATLSTNKKRLILENVGGKDIFLSNIVAGSPGFTAKVVDEEGIAVSQFISLSGDGEQQKADNARFSGIVKIISSSEFSLTNSANITAESRLDPTEGSFVEITGNSSSDSKLVSFGVESDADENEASSDGLRAVASGAIYQMSVLTENEDISFSANLSSSQVSPLNESTLNKAIIDELRSEALLATLSGGEPAAKAQSVEYTFSGPVVIDSANDSLAITVGGTTVNINMLDGDGLGTPVTTNQLLMQAAARAINLADIGVVATTEEETSAGVTSYKFIITSEEVGNSFTMGAVDFNDADNQSTIEMTDSSLARPLPEDGDAVYLDYAGQTYKIEKSNGEIIVTGGEPGRITAYFDSDFRLQVFAGGTLSGQQITLTGDNIVSNNSTAAERFGLSKPLMKFSGQEIDAARINEPLKFVYNSEEFGIQLDSSGKIISEPTNLPDGLSAEFAITSPGKGRVQLTYNSLLGKLEFIHPQDNMGVKVAGSDLHLVENGIRVNNINGDVQNVTASSESLVGQKIEVSDYVVEDLLVFVTGGGAKSLTSIYDVPQLSGSEEQQALLGQNGLTLRSVSDSGSIFDIIDTDTGHSIATRTLDDKNSTSFSKYKFTLKSVAANGDEFLIEETSGSSGDARNLLMLIEQQTKDMNGKHSGGFSDIFSGIIAGVGASVSASSESLSGAEATKEAAVEAEAEFSGVNLDSEAAALIEFQQAYQASARILSTARELFQTLIDVV